MKSTLSIGALLLATLGIIACKSASNTETKTVMTEASSVVAKLNGVDITNQDLEEFSKGQLYQMKVQVLDGLVNKTLVDAKAKALGKSVEEFMKLEIFDKVAEPSDAELQATYDQLKASGRQLPPFAEIKADLSQYVKQQRFQSVEKAYYDELRSSASLEVKLAKYRAAVSTKGPTKGSKDAQVTIVEFSDFQCPACSQGEQLVAEVLKAYPTQVKIVYRDFPLNIHPDAPKASEAAHCADEQGKYWDMHGKLFENQRALGVASLKEYAKTLGLDTAKFEKCLDSSAKKTLVDAGVKEGMNLGIQGTPSFFVNGVPVMLQGASPLEAFKKVIDEELALKKKA